MTLAHKTCDFRYWHTHAEVVRATFADHLRKGLSFTCAIARDLLHMLAYCSLLRMHFVSPRHTLHVIVILYSDDPHARVCLCLRNVTVVT